MHADFLIFDKGNWLKQVARRENNECDVTSESRMAAETNSDHKYQPAIGMVLSSPGIS
jgi:hypothetical protein